MSNFHFYNDLSQLGLSTGASINNLLAKMPAPSVGVFYCLSKSITGLPFDTQCMVTIFKNGDPFRIEVQDIWSGRTYVAIYSGGTVGKFVEYALKSDLSNFVVTRQISADVTIPNGSPYSTSTHDITCDIPSGYKYVGILRAWCIDPSCFVWNAYFRDEGKNAKIDVSNLNGTQKNTTIFISVLYAKS